jgi:hypothetical protein
MRWRFYLGCFAFVCFTTGIAGVILGLQGLVTDQKTAQTEKSKTPPPAPPPPTPASPAPPAPGEVALTESEGKDVEILRLNEENQQIRIQQVTDMVESKFHFREQQQKLVQEDKALTAALAKAHGIDLSKYLLMKDKKAFVPIPASKAVEKPAKPTSSLAPMPHEGDVYYPQGVSLQDGKKLGLEAGYMFWCQDCKINPKTRACIQSKTPAFAMAFSKGDNQFVCFPWPGR